MHGPGQAALTTLPERRHLVQTLIWRTPFGVWALTRCRLGFHFLGDDLWEWLTLCPKTGPLAQISQTFGMIVSLSFGLSRFYTIKPAGRQIRAPRRLDPRGQGGYPAGMAGSKRPSGVLLVFLLAVALSLAACARPLGPGPLEAGVAAAQDDRWEEAVRFWEQAVARDPASAAAHNNLAVAFEKRGAFDEAGREYEAALRLGPSNPAIRDNYRAFKARLEAGRGRRP